MAKKDNIELFYGKTINNLKIIEEVEPHITKGGNKHRKVKCLCICGNIKDFQFSSIKNNIVKSCGCHSAKMASDRMKKYNFRHGMNLTSEYNIWQSMKKRCLNKANKNYCNYGGRGINICKEWIESFNNFYNDMGNKPTKQHSLDRINNDLGYYKENCRWATKKEQTRNQRSNRLIEYNNEIKCVSEWIELLGLTRYEITNKIK